MAGLNDFAPEPNIGVNYLNLANVTQPQMQPNAPIGGGAQAGFQYGMDKGRQDYYINQAGGLADLDAQLKQHAAALHEMETPGLMADIQRKNAVSKDSLDAYQTGGIGRSNTFNEFYNKATETQQKTIDDSLKRLTPLINALHVAQSPEEIQAAQEMAGHLLNGNTKLGKIDLATTDPKKAKALAEAIYNSESYSPAEAAKERQLNIQGGYHVAGSQATATGRVTAAQITAEAHLASAALASQGRSNTASVLNTLGQKYAAALAGKGTITKEEVAMYNGLRADAMAVNASKAANTNPPIDPESLNSGSELHLNPPSVPKPAALPVPPAPQATPAMPAPGSGPMNGPQLDLKRGVAIVAGKPLKIVSQQRDSTTGKIVSYTLQDGSKIPAQ